MYLPVLICELRAWSNAQAASALAQLGRKDYEAGLDRVFPFGEDDDELNPGWEETT
jgi:hypothetical protein